MLNISYEFRKGILFVRLIGELTKDTSKQLRNEITDMIEDNGITNVVFNISKLILIDREGVNNLLKNFEICKKNNGNALLCCTTKENMSLFNDTNLFDDNIIQNELSAFGKIKI